MRSSERGREGERAFLIYVFPPSLLLLLLFYTGFDAAEKARTPQSRTTDSKRGSFVRGDSSELGGRSSVFDCDGITPFSRPFEEAAHKERHFRNASARAFDLKGTDELSLRRIASKKPKLAFQV